MTCVGCSRHKQRSSSRGRAVSHRSASRARSPEREAAYSRTSRLPDQNHPPVTASTGASQAPRMGPLGIPQDRTPRDRGERRALVRKRAVEAESPRRWPANVKRPKVNESVQ